MLRTYHYEQLDPATKAYLRDVRAMKGNGAPGVYYGQTFTRPLWAFLAGITITPIFLYIAYISTKAPMAVAALQTAAVLLGGWLCLYAFRRWTASADSFAGWFFYFDPAHVFLGEGETIKIAALPTDTDISPTGASGVQFVSAREDDGFFVNMPTRIQAAFVTDYYAAFDWVNSREEGRWAGLPLAEAGAVAKYLVEADAEPPSVQDTGLRFDAIPEEVVSVRRPKSNILMYLAIVGVGIGCFALFSAVNPVVQDNRAFNNAKDNLGKSEEPGITGAQGLRDYLLNERNQKHRPDAIRLLSELYDKPINNLKSAPGTDPILRDGMVSLLDSLRDPAAPAVSIAVTDKDPTSAILEEKNIKGLRQLFADGIATTVGKDLITFLEPPKDGGDKRALLDITYKSNRNGTVEWWVEIRLKPEDKEPIAKSSGKAIYTPNFNVINPNPNPFGLNPTPNVELAAAAFNEVTDAVYKDVMLKMVGVGNPPKTPAVVADWD